ncbi:MAG: HAD family hydrolase [Candidatus Helarchaeota archaeon]
MVLIFDLDGVLVGSTFFSDVLMNILCRKLEEHNISIELPALFQEILNRFITKLGSENKSLAYDWDLLIHEYMSEHNIPWHNEIEEFFCSNELLNYIYLYRDTDILEWLIEKGHAMAILTNGLPKYQEQVIEKLGIQRFFQRIIMPNPETVNMVKPYLEIFELAMKDFQDNPIMIGDSLYFDIYGGKKAGCQTIWIHRKLPNKYKTMPIATRTEKINRNPKFLLKYILRSAPFLKLTATDEDVADYKPDFVIYTLRELKELV